MTSWSRDWRFGWVIEQQEKRREKHKTDPTSRCARQRDRKKTMKRRIYIAAPGECAARAEMVGRAIVDLVPANVIVSRWHRAVAHKYPLDKRRREEVLTMAIDDIERATHLVVLTDTGVPRSTFAKLGYAIARGLPVVWVAGKEPSQRCIWDAHSRIRVLHLPAKAGLEEVASTILEAFERGDVKR